MTSFTNCGDLGDLFLSLATIQHRGDVAHCYLHDDGKTKGMVIRMHLVKSLLEAQPYISGVSAWNGEDVDWRSEKFRVYGFYNNGNSLAYNHAEAAYKDGFITTFPDLSKKWLTVEPAKLDGRVVVNVTDRYRNDYFPWRKVVDHYGKRILFIGTTNEHRSFSNSFGEVEYLPTKDMLEAAKAIAGSSLMMGNQSSCMAIAEGLKHPRIQEGNLRIPDCVYPGAHNAQYVFDGSTILPDIDDSGELVIPQQAFKWEEFELNMVPKHKNGWGWFYQYEDVEICESMCKNTAAKLAKLSGLPLQECKERVIRYNVEMSPAFFGRYLNLNHFQKAKNALMAAGCAHNSVFGLSKGGLLRLA